VVSSPEVNRRLRSFVCVRLDWEQMQKHRSRWKTPTQGNQVLLGPNGDYIPGVEPRGKRYPVEELVPLLDRILARYPPHTAAIEEDLRLATFFWNPRDQGLPDHFGAEFVSRLDRKPIAALSGPPPAWLDRPEFLGKHLRQFIWTRGERRAEPHLTVRYLEPECKQLLSLPLTGAEPAEVTRALDSAWREYMKVRPMVARGYIDNPHGRWLKPVMERVHLEELRLREEALAGTLKPPGR
jgi:hypothetical protein